jgi:hypothetical protein
MEQALTWGALVTAIGLALTVGGYVWRLADRSAKNEAAADAAQKTANGSLARVIDLEKQLTEHRVETAREYATTKALDKLQDAFTGAIDKLGDRIDAAFLHRPHK